MAKRKCEFESEESSAPCAKQLKSIPFPGYDQDNDVAMSDASSEVDSVTNSPESHHIRLASTGSNGSAGSFESPPVNYPTFNLYPLVPDTNMQNVGLLQPKKSFRHHGTSCQQIPKLRVACSPGLNGSRTMWSFCEECGAISQVDSD